MVGVESRNGWGVLSAFRRNGWGSKLNWLGFGLRPFPRGRSWFFLLGCDRFAAVPRWLSAVVRDRFAAVHPWPSPVVCDRFAANAGSSK